MCACGFLWQEYAKIGEQMMGMMGPGGAGAGGAGGAAAPTLGTLGGAGGDAGSGGGAMSMPGAPPGMGAMAGMPGMPPGMPGETRPTSLKSMSPKYEPSSEPLHISVKYPASSPLRPHACQHAPSLPRGLCRSAGLIAGCVWCPAF